MVIFLLMFASGVLGRMGGAKGYETKWRDLGCPFLFIVAWIYSFGYMAEFWWVYTITYLLMFASLTTYWDWLFKGEDNLWFSGFIVGLSAMPLLIIDYSIFTILLIRTIIIMVIWGCLNKYLPQRLFFWNRDVVEEFSRYAVSL